MSSTISKIKRTRAISDIKTVSNYVMNNYLFKMNSHDLRCDLVEELTKKLDVFTILKKIHSFTVLCDDTNNTPTIIHNNQLITDIVIQPTELSPDCVTMRCVLGRKQ